MADNLTAPATGAVLATDEVAGVHYPKSKLAHGAADEAVDVTEETPFPVKDGASGPIGSAAAVTPNDSTDLAAVARAIYVGTAGNLSIVLADDSAPVLLKSIAVGYHPLRAKRVRATGTTAADIVALY